MRSVFVLLAALAAIAAVPAAAQDAACDMFPPQVDESDAYSGFSERNLCQAGLSALWQGVPGETGQVLRFTFTGGHAQFWRTVTVTEMTDGAARLEVVGEGSSVRTGRMRGDVIRPVRRRLAPEDLGRIVDLAGQSGAFNFEVGTWDGQDGQSIYLHCQLLEMERADSDGYRFSSVNIGCNRPSRLMPLVDAVIDLAGIGMVRENWAGFAPGQ